MTNDAPTAEETARARNLAALSMPSAFDNGEGTAGVWADIVARNTDPARLTRFMVDAVKVDAKALQPIGMRHLGSREAVIIHIFGRSIRHLHPFANMPRPVELGAHLTEFAGDELVVKHQALLPYYAARGIAGRHDGIRAVPEEGHTPLVDIAEFVELSGLDQRYRLQDFLWRDPVRPACLVVRPPEHVRPPGAGLAGLGRGRG